MKKIVIDTNVFVSALRSFDAARSSSRALLRAILAGRYVPLFSTALVFEYEDLLNRNDIWTTATTYSERRKIFRALIACGQFVTIYYRWRPNLQDEGDNFLLELAIAGNAEAIITFNKQDFYQGQLVWPFLRVMTPAECLEGLE